MILPHFIRESKFLRRPLLAASRTLFSLLYKGPVLLRRAVYDAMPVPYLVTGHPEHFVIETKDKGTGRMLFMSGEQDFWKLQVALTILQREGAPQPSHLIDVGANIGTIVIPAIRRGLFKTGTAIEAHPNNVRLLRANIALNEVDDFVTVLNVAIGNESGKQIYLREVADDSSTHSIDNDGIPVCSLRLDDLIFPAQALLWMDIEGYEGHALEGAKSLLSTGIPVVSEFHPEFLARAGGFESFKQALEGRKIFDLQADDQSPTTLTDITRRLSAKKRNLQWTDILAIN